MGGKNKWKTVTNHEQQGGRRGMNTRNCADCSNHVFHCRFTHNGKLGRSIFHNLNSNLKSRADAANFRIYNRSNSRTVRTFELLYSSNLPDGSDGSRVRLV